MTLVGGLAAAIFLMGSCQRKPVLPHASYLHLPLGGWQCGMPLSFAPQYDDSTASYDITLAVRHDAAYDYRNLSIVVDVIAADSTVDRHNVNMTLADEYGNWSGGGFGTLYQATTPVVTGVRPDQARSVVVWQAMTGIDTLRGIESVGLITRPNKNR